MSAAVVGVNHAQVNVPTASLEAAREFYIGFLGLKEIHRPPVFKSAGVCSMRAPLSCISVLRMVSIE